MGRPRNDPIMQTRAQIAPPADLSPTLLRLWRRELARFPPGYYVPSDTSGLVLYLQTLDDYEAAQRRAVRARSAERRRAEREEVRAIRRQLIVLQRALRMYPSTRGDPSKMAGLAHDPAKQATPDDDGRPRWQQMMDSAQGKLN